MAGILVKKFLWKPYFRLYVTLGHTFPFAIICSVLALYFWAYIL